MHLIPHWIPLVASLGLLAGGSSASAAEEAFDLWNECAKACVLDLKDGVRSSRMSVDPNGQGVLHYSMVLEGGNDALKLAIDNALSITSDGLTIRLEGGVEPNKPVRYSYTRQARGSWSLNWLVPIGHEKPSNIKVFIHELNAGNQLSHMSPIYTIEMGDELLAKLARDATFFVRAHESNEMQPTLAISHAGVSVVMAQAQPRREKRWSEWASGKVLCLLDPLDIDHHRRTVDQAAQPRVGRLCPFLLAPAFADVEQHAGQPQGTAAPQRPALDAQPAALAAAIRLTQAKVLGQRLAAAQAGTQAQAELVGVRRLQQALQVFQRHPTILAGQPQAIVQGRRQFEEFLLRPVTPPAAADHLLQQPQLARTVVLLVEFAAVRHLVRQQFREVLPVLRRGPLGELLQRHRPHQQCPQAATAHRRRHQVERVLADLPEQRRGAFATA